MSACPTALSGLYAGVRPCARAGRLLELCERYG
jgi:hypothetical protein